MGNRSGFKLPTKKPGWWDLIETARDLYKAHKQYSEESQRELDYLKTLEEDHKKIWKDFVDCQEKICLEFYSCWPEAFEDCMRGCLKKFDRDIEKYIWNPKKEICEKYGHDPRFVEYCR